MSEVSEAQELLEMARKGMIGIDDLEELRSLMFSRQPAKGDVALKVWLSQQKEKGKDTAATRLVEEMLK